MVSDKDNGFVSKFNCKFLGKNIDRIYDATCINFVGPIFKIIIALIFITLSMSVVAICSLCLGIRISRNLKQKAKIFSDGINKKSNYE